MIHIDIVAHILFFCKGFGETLKKFTKCSNKGNTILTPFVLFNCSLPLSVLPSKGPSRSSESFYGEPELPFQTEKARDAAQALSVLFPKGAPPDDSGGGVGE